MPKLFVVDRDGEKSEVEATTGMSVMEVVRDAGFDDLLALCGGVCSCATCHVHVDPSYQGMLPPMSEEEDELLDSSDDRDDDSRLSCQLRMTEELDGMTVRIAEED